nr:helix-turn-helix domain-containing protein [Pantoea sp. BAV 3049]
MSAAFYGNISKTAHALGVARSTLYRRAAREKGLSASLHLKMTNCSFCDQYCSTR